MKLKKTISTALTFLATTLALTVTASADSVDTPNGTPLIDKVFNGYAISALKDGRVASPEEIIDNMLPLVIRSIRNRY